MRDSGQQAQGWGDALSACLPEAEEEGEVCLPLLLCASFASGSQLQAGSRSVKLRATTMAVSST